MRPLALAALLCMAAGLAAAQSPSPAERLSEEELPLTSEEVARTAAECALSPKPAGTIPDILGRQHVSVLSFPAIRVLRVYGLQVEGADYEGARIERFDPLLFGAIGERDHCGAVDLFFRETRDGLRRQTYTMGLRLRPGLVLMDDYPSAGPEILRRGQIFDVPAGAYLLIEAIGETINEGRILNSNDARIDWSRPVIVLRPGQALVPLIEMPG